MKYDNDSERTSKQKREELEKKLRIDVKNSFIASDSYAEFKLDVVTKYGYNPFFLFDFYWWYNFSRTHVKLSKWMNRAVPLLGGFISYLIAEEMFHNWYLAFIPCVVFGLVHGYVTNRFSGFAFELEYEQDYYNENGKFLWE